MELEGIEYVNAKQAESLKDKDFNEITEKYWEKINQSDLEYQINTDYIAYRWNSMNSKTVFSAPEHWQVVKWLRVNHGIWINVTWDIESASMECIKWNSTIDKIGSLKDCNYLYGYNSPQEATSAAIDYVLEKLI